MIWNTKRNYAFRFNRYFEFEPNRLFRYGSINSKIISNRTIQLTFRTNFLIMDKTSE